MVEDDLAFAREHGQRAMESEALIAMGMLAGQRGSRSEAQELNERGLALQRDLGWEIDVIGFTGCAGDMELGRPFLPSSRGGSAYRPNRSGGGP